MGGPLYWILLSSVSNPQGGCFSSDFFSFSKHTFLLMWSSSLFGLQAREWQKLHGAVLLPTSRCYSTGSAAGKTPVQWSYRVQTFCPGLTEITHFDIYCLECPVLSIHMISLTFGLSSSAYIPTPIHISFINMIIFLLKSYAVVVSLSPCSQVSYEVRYTVVWLGIRNYLVYVFKAHCLG